MRMEDKNSILSFFDLINLVIYNKFMPSKFIFIRHGQLIKPYSNHLEMGYADLADLASGKADPSLSKNAKKLFSKQAGNLDFSRIETIYFNNSTKQSKRSFESAKIIVGILEKKLNKTL